MPRPTQRWSESHVAQGSVFVEFDDMSAVEAFLNADPKPSWEGTELLIMSKWVLILRSRSALLIVEAERRIAR